MRTPLGPSLVLLGAVVAACAGDEAAPRTGTSDSPVVGGADVGVQEFPDVVDVEITADGDTYRFDVTISSPYDTPERYADAWRIVAPDGTVLGVRELTHDHADEQPFTRSLSSVEIPSDVSTVTVEGRDLVNGWGGGTQTVALDR